MAKKVLIAGASGLIGTRLTEILLEKGFEVFHLGRSQKQAKVPVYLWNVEQGKMDPEAIQQVDAIINLAGAGVADKRWTRARKKEILDSRVRSTALLADALKKENHHVTVFVSASAVGYYGLTCGDKWQTENDKPGTDFLAQVVAKWEEAAVRISTDKIRVVRLRIGIVLSEKGGALKSMATPIKYGVGAPLGDGKQYLSWIHIDDLCHLFIKSIEDPTMTGPYNAVGIEPVTNRALTKAIAIVLKRPLWAPLVPGFVLRLILGEMADMVIYGARISSNKILQAGFKHQFTTIDGALRNLLSGR